MKKISASFLFTLFLFYAVSGFGQDIRSQTFQFTYSFTIKDIPKDAKEIKFWVPYPTEDSYQFILKSKIDLPGKYTMTRDAKYNNRILYGIYENKGDSTLSGTITYEIKRLERPNKPLYSPVEEQGEYSGDFVKFLQPSTFATISPQIRTLAKKITDENTPPLTKARAIYDYVLSNMEYNKEVPGWGLGDTERACDIKKGNCTDFHSLFTSLARAVNIPAKFVIGFNIPDKEQSVITGYHCWAEFYDVKSGWIPVDISEAWKDPSKREYYFGNLNENRVEFTVGRDIILNSAQNEKPVNYFIYPYAEIDGEETCNIEVSSKSRVSKIENRGEVNDTFLCTHLFMSK